MNSINSLDTIYFITLPEGFELSKNAMHIDPTIPLPVQKKEKDSGGNFRPEELSQEQILSGILTVLAYDHTNEHLDYYRSILKEARPDLKKELSEAAILKTKNEDFDLAEEIYKALRSFDPEDQAILLNYALFLDQRGESYRRMHLEEDANAYDSDAEAAYIEVMDNDPPIPDAYFNAGFYYLRLHNFHKATDCFETYIALTCDLPDDDLGKNGIYKKERAQEILNTIKNDNLDNELFHDAYLLISQDKVSDGIEKVHSFIQKNPDVWNAWFLLGWGLRKEEQWENAEKAFLKAIELGGDKQADTYNELSLCCIELKKLEEAHKYLTKALSMAPENTKIISNLGYLYLKEGKVSEARKYFTTVLEIDPNDKIALEELKNMEI